MIKEQTKTYIASTFNLALKKVKSELGPNAMILSHETINGQAHVVAMPEKPAVISNETKEIHHEDTFSSILLAGSKRKSSAISKNKITDTAKLHNDVQYIKSILQNNVLKLQTHANHENNRYLHKLRKKLRLKGFVGETIDKILYGALECTSFEMLTNVITDNMIHLIQCQKMDFCSQRKVKAFIGPSGGGKTTLITKVVMYLLENKLDANISLIFVNHSNIKVMEEAKILGRVFNISSYYVENSKELEAAYHQSYDRSNVFIEFPSLDQRNSANNFFFEFIGKFANDIDTTLVLPSMTNATYIEKFITSYSHLKFDGLIITKCDENHHTEEVLNAAIHYQLPLRFISESADISFPLIVATKEYFLSHFKSSYFSPHLRQQTNKLSFESNEAIVS